jgi:hypothetical protein
MFRTPQYFFRFLLSIYLVFFAQFCTVSAKCAEILRNFSILLRDVPRFRASLHVSTPYVFAEDASVHRFIYTQGHFVDGLNAHLGSE